MRPIKFRAWNTYAKTMYPADNFALRADGVWLQLMAEDDVWLPTTGSMTFMQFTGLHDRNGKEIYEGDVVKCQQGCSHEVKYVMDIGGTFFGGMPGFTLDGLLRNGGEGYAWSGEEEVIGNIYENPDLLSV